MNVVGSGLGSVVSPLFMWERYRLPLTSLVHSWYETESEVGSWYGHLSQCPVRVTGVRSPGEVTIRSRTPKSEIRTGVPRSTIRVKSRSGRGLIRPTSSGRGHGPIGGTQVRNPTGDTYVRGPDRDIWVTRPGTFTWGHGPTRVPGSQVGEVVWVRRPDRFTWFRDPGWDVWVHGSGGWTTGSVG